MFRLLGYILALIFLAGIAYAVYVFVPRGPVLSVATLNATSSESGMEMKTEVIYGNTDTYRIEVHYPQFGIPSVDAKIKSVVDNAIATFKEYPANPPDMASPQNELMGSFNAVYVGPDIVSVELSLSEYTGGAHPNTAIIGVNVDRTTGKELSLDDALAMIGKDLPQVAEESLKELKATLGADLIAPEGARAMPENYSVFLVSKDKVTFVFNNYQVAPYSSGPQEVWFARR